MVQYSKHADSGEVTRPKWENEVSKPRMNCSVQSALEVEVSYEQRCGVRDMSWFFSHVETKRGQD